MDDGLIQVDTDVLRDRAGELTGSGYRLAHGLAGAPGLLVDAPGWATAEAIAELESAGHAWLGRVGARVAAAASGLRSAADAYEAADDRAARRLAGSR